MRILFKKTFVALTVSALFGCAGKPIIQTQVIDRPVPVPCEVEMPPECKDAYAMERVSTKDDALAINRALRAEIEERWACEIKLRAAVKGCNAKAEVR
jgi:hypothetical protein